MPTRLQAAAALGDRRLPFTPTRTDNNYPPRTVCPLLHNSSSSHTNRCTNNNSCHNSYSNHSCTNNNRTFLTQCNMVVYSIRTVREPCISSRRKYFLRLPHHRSISNTAPPVATRVLHRFPSPESAPRLKTLVVVLVLERKSRSWLPNRNAAASTLPSDRATTRISIIMDTDDRSAVPLRTVASTGPFGAETQT